MRALIATSRGDTKQGDTIKQNPAVRQICQKAFKAGARACKIRPSLLLHVLRKLASYSSAVTLRSRTAGSASHVCTGAAAAMSSVTQSPAEARVGTRSNAF